MTEPELILEPGSDLAVNLGIEPPAMSLEQAVDVLALAATKLNEAATALPDWQESVRLLDRLRVAIEECRIVDANLVRHIYLQADHGDVDVEGIGRVSITRSRDRKEWDVRGAVQAVLDRQLEAVGGEMPNDPWQVVEWVLSVASAYQCRVTPLRDLGLDPADYCTETLGAPTVRLPPR